MSEPTMSPSPRVADRPHGWTLVLASGSVFVSLLALFQSYEARRAAEINVSIARAANGAYVRIVSAVLNTGASTFMGDTGPKRVLLSNVDYRVKNFGRAPALNIEVY